MAEKLQYELTLRTSATGTGARDTAAAMDKVAASTAKTADASARFLTAAEREVAEVDRLVRSAQRLSAEKAQLVGVGPKVETFLRRTSDEARVAEVAFYDLDRAVDRMTRTSDSGATAVLNAGKGVKNMGTIATQAGFQVQDFAVQVGAGTSALTALGQQAPQFLGVFGPAGAIAGALVAVGAVAANIFFKMGGDADSATKKAGFAADVLQKTADNVAAIKLEDIDRAVEKIDSITDAQRDLAQSFPRTKEASNAASLAVIENAQKEIEARRTLNELLGKTADKFKEIRELQGLDKASTGEKAAQSMAAENDKVLQAANEADLTRKNADAKYMEVSKAVAELAKARGELDAARNEMAQLKKTANEVSVTMAPSPDLPFAAMQPTASPTLAANKAQETLESGTVQNRVKILESTIEALSSKVEGDGSLLKIAQAASQKAEVAANTLKDTQSATVVNVDRIQATLDADTSAAAIKAAAEQGELLAKGVTEAVKQIDTTTEAGKATKERLQKAAEDGKITLQEIETLGLDLRTIIGLVQSGQTITSANQQLIISLLRGLQTENENFKKQLLDLQK